MKRVTREGKLRSDRKKKVRGEKGGGGPKGR